MDNVTAQYIPNSYPHEKRKDLVIESPTLTELLKFYHNQILRMNGTKAERKNRPKFYIAIGQHDYNQGDKISHARIRLVNFKSTPSFNKELLKRLTAPPT